MGPELNPAAALTAFLIILPSELPDKTVFACLVMGTRYRPVFVFVGAAAAFGTWPGAPMAAPGPGWAPVAAASMSSSASPHGSGRMTMPGPPPNRVSSTVRCVSCAHERRSCTPTLISPRCTALPISEMPSGAKYSGNIVMMSRRTA